MALRLVRVAGSMPHQPAMTRGSICLITRKCRRRMQREVEGVPWREKSVRCRSNGRLVGFQRRTRGGASIGLDSSNK